MLKYLEIAKGNDWYGNKALFYRQAFPFIFQGHKPIFTHGDLQRKNVMITRAAAPGDSGKWSNFT